MFESDASLLDEFRSFISTGLLRPMFGVGAVTGNVPFSTQSHLPPRTSLTIFPFEYISPLIDPSRKMAAISWLFVFCLLCSFVPLRRMLRASSVHSSPCPQYYVFVLGVRILSELGLGSSLLNCYSRSQCSLTFRILHSAGSRPPP